MNRPAQTQYEVEAQLAAPLLGKLATARSLLAAAVALSACALVAPSVLGDCKCHEAKADDTTRFGGNMAIVAVEKEPHRGIEGTVVGGGDGRSVEGALVEVLDHPEYLVSDKPWAEHPQQKRIAACVTSSDGKFCFRRLPPGKYELRSSLNSGWNVTHIYVTVDKKAGQSKEIRVEMSVGT